MKSGINTNIFSQPSEETNDHANSPLERLGLFPFLSCSKDESAETEWMKKIEKEVPHVQESTCKIPKYVFAHGIMKLNPEFAANSIKDETINRKPTP